MARNQLVVEVFFVISLTICATAVQLGNGRNDLFGISAPGNSKDESESVSSLGGKIILQEDDKACKSDSDCLYGGTCTEKGSCSCPEGTNGTLCENVIECMENPELCGEGTDVKCVFDVKTFYAYCTCNDKKKSFNDLAKRCQEPCERPLKNETIKKDCGMYGECVERYCQCAEGVSGDFCEKIEKCENVDCGSDPTTTCILGIVGAYCKCNKSYQVFDEKEKICKGEPCLTNSDCSFNGECNKENGTCSCPAGTTGPRCQDVIECIKKPNMCGNGTDVKCTFSVFDKYAYCACDGKRKAFNTFSEKCEAPCEFFIKHERVVEDCGEYGRCKNSFCVCIPGTSGDRCEVIDQCASREVDCSNEPSANCSLGINGAYCKCHKPYQVYDETEKKCKGEPCKTNDDCQHGGNCTEDGTCFCKKGLGGPLCQRVLECEEKPDMCGKGTDVKCVFSDYLKKAACECDDEEKGFDVKEMKCKKGCEDGECGLFGKCDRKGFCRCLEGVSGDNCGTIEKCGQLNCGDGANCTLGSDLEARCRCPDSLQGYDYESGKCKACECGDNSPGCEFRGGVKTCECALNYYHKGGKCEACNCGDISSGCELRDGKKECYCPLNYTTVGEKCQKCSCGIGSYHCKTEGEKTKCVCYEPYKQRIDKCEFCDCGVHDGECSFDESGKKQCACTPGFKMLEETGFCTQMCNETNKCKNGGLCVEELCKCREDYAGAWCETPKWCLHNRCGHHFNQDHVDCIWDGDKKEGRCKCKDPKSFYMDDRTCDKCDCGDHGYCMLTEKGEKVCICDDRYADYLLNCKSCDCGLESINCTFASGGVPVCQCKENYKQKGEEQNDAICAYCDCGKHGSCRFGGRYMKEKICDCEENYKVYNGACEECNCGPYGFCSFDSDGNKVCTCDFGYSVLKGRCESCDCEPSDLRGIGSVCLFGKSGKECHCPEGYESLGNDTCKDIDECLNATACPANTNCLNLPGSYSCHCKEGFKMIDPKQDPKQSACEDVNECAENPCTGSNTECVNTPGSYDCKCKSGYYPTSSTSGPYRNPKYATCDKKETQWRAASIALGVILTVGILGVGAYICYLKKGNQR